MKILNKKQETILQGERNFLNDLQLELAENNATKEDLNSLKQSIRQLDDLFLIVIVGEFNSGKSAFINALLGQQLLKEGVTPTTDQINILRYGEKNERHVVEKDQVVLLFPVELLSELSIVDTPGTNAIIRQHEDLTTHFVPRADLILFVTSVDRPFTESERSFMQSIRDWGKKVVIILNKIDILEDEEELTQVMHFVKENAQTLMGRNLEIFPVSARQALRAKTGESHLWEASRFEALETYIRDSLDQAGQIKLKFMNPLGVAAHLADRYSQVAVIRLEILEEDIKLLQNVERQQAAYLEDMQKNFKFRMTDVEKIFYEMEQRGDEFFEDRFRLTRVLKLLKKEHMQEDFSKEVIADVPLQVERKVNTLIDWLVDADLQQWKTITDYLTERERKHKESIIGEGINTDFVYDRKRLLDAIGKEAEHVVESYNKHAEASQIAEDAKNAVATSVAVEIGAVGLGALITILASTAAADFTGILAASVIAALGLFIVPTKRRQAKNELHEKLAELRIKLIRSLSNEFEKEIKQSQQRIEDAISPYTRFIRAETKNIEEFQDELKEAHVKIEQLQTEIESW
ncbi:MAG: dynamin family protein [Anaerolineaceae bacterium]